MRHLDEALHALQQTLDAPARLPLSWHHHLTTRLAAVVEALTMEPDVATDPWLAARAARLQRERERLMARVSVVYAMLEEHADPIALRPALTRLASDIMRHRARSDDLVYDEVSLDVGGSE